MKRLKVVVLGIAIFVFIVASVLFLIKLKMKITQNRKIASEEVVLKEAQTLEAQGNLLKVKEMYQKLIRDYPQ